MKVIYKPVGSKPFPVEIDCDLESFQNLVGGYFEYYSITPDLAIVCNEDGKLKRMEYNCTVLNSRFVGPVFFVGRGRESAETYGWKDCPATLEEVTRLCAGKLKWREN